MLSPGDAIDQLVAQRVRAEEPASAYLHPGASVEVGPLRDGTVVDARQPDPEEPKLMRCHLSIVRGANTCLVRACRPNGTNWLVGGTILRPMVSTVGDAGGKSLCRRTRRSAAG